MASNAFNGHLKFLLTDAVQLGVAVRTLPRGTNERVLKAAAMNRAAVVLGISAWEAYIEELVREALDLLRPPAPPLGPWPALNAAVRGQLGRFNNPSAENVRLLLSDALGLADIRTAWVWQNCTPAQAVQRLAAAMTLRHQIAHGVNPRPVVSNTYAFDLSSFVGRLARCTDDAVREHLEAVLGIAHPWPR